MNWKIWTICGAIALVWVYIFFQLREPAAASSFSTRNIRSDLSGFARQCLLGADYKTLGSELDRVRKDKTKLTDGSWQLPVFFNGLTTPRGREVESWDEHGAALEAWGTAEPTSVPAQIAMAGYLRNRAQFDRRGDNDLPADQRAAIRQASTEKIAQAAEISDQTLASKTVWPEAYLQRLEIAGSQNMPFPERKALIERAAKLEPSYYDIYTLFLGVYSPQRKGIMPEGENLANYAEWCRSIAGGEGKAVYARVAAASSRWFGDDFFEASKLDWPQVRDGFQKIVSKYPDSPLLLNQFCRLACLAGDAGLAKKLFAKIGEDYQGQAWKNREEFQGWKDKLGK